MEKKAKDKIESITLGSYDVALSKLEPISYNDNGTTEILRNISKEQLESQSIFLTAEHNKAKFLKKQLEQLQTQNRLMAQDIDSIKYNTQTSSIGIVSIENFLKWKMDYSNTFKSLIKTIQIGIITISSVIAFFSIIIIGVLLK